MSKTGTSLKPSRPKSVQAFQKNLGREKIPEEQDEKGAETVESGKGEGEGGILEKYPYLVAEFSRALPDNECGRRD
ncbi:hypothetical protein F3Y22_tig00111388pilonHSYRG00001 [Hibiscus syriacus]|uniref:Uncharacterized protein n=1 Tax=Hibiscus syriacus TaxID=106335 RepID=A0A6A2YM52_HIBSY|nr:hypothetical protein F3Y22_tig00111388pilonHSYRG00001 [Hibiscus syriacus]